MANIWKYSVITKKGIALMAKTIVGDSINITAVRAGTGTVPADTLVSLTDMTNAKQEVVLQPLRMEGTTAIIPVLLTNNDLEESYNLTQIGFFAEDPIDGEILFAIAQNEKEREIPTATEVPGYSLAWNFHFILVEGVNLNLNVNPAGLVTVETMNLAIEKAKKEAVESVDLSTKADKENTVITGTFSQNRNSNDTPGQYSSTLGFSCMAQGDNSHAQGYMTTALDNQHVQGHYNDTSLAKAANSSGTGTGTLFCIGNGTQYAPSNAFRITANGQPMGKQAYGASGADMAELREWQDGNPENEDRRGYFVTMDGMKIRKAAPGDYICGIISANPCVLGNNDDGWMGKYVYDEFGAFVYEEVEMTLEDGNKTTCTTYKLNPDYDPEKSYTSRIERPEWDYVGLCGVIHVRDDGSCEINGFCRCGEGGVATKAERGYRVLERVNENIVKILFFLTGEIF